MALVTPLYQLIARACWRYGLADLLDPVAWWAKGSEVTKEIMSYDRELREAGQNLTARERVLGPDHPDTLTSRNNLANAYQAAGRTDEAITLHEQNLTARERVLGPDHPDTLTSRKNLRIANLEALSSWPSLQLDFDWSGPQPPDPAAEDGTDGMAQHDHDHDNPNGPR